MVHLSCTKMLASHTERRGKSGTEGPNVCQKEHLHAVCETDDLWPHERRCGSLHAAVKLPAAATNTIALVGLWSQIFRLWVSHWVGHSWDCPWALRPAGVQWLAHVLFYLPNLQMSLQKTDEDILLTPKAMTNLHPDLVSSALRYVQAPLTVSHLGKS